MKKALPLTLILIGSVFLVTAIVFLIDMRTATEPPSLGTTFLNWTALIMGMGTFIKGWKDLFNKKTAPPPIEYHKFNGNTQISKGENAPNNLTQIYIKNQYIQQLQKSKNNLKNITTEPVTFPDMKAKGQNFRSGSRIRFLDALDSARFSHQTINNNTRLISVLYVKAQLFFAMINGDSIVISENQFFDSLGFIESFDELYHAAKDVGLETDLPIKIALRTSNNNLFQAVANNIGNESFILTLWKDLESNADRRRLWSNSIRSEQKPIGEIVLAEEVELLDKLWTALKYFNPNRCVSADNSDEFTKRIKKIVDLKNEGLDDMHSGKSMGVNQRKFFKSKEEVDAAKEIRDVLIEIQKKIGEIKTRSDLRRELINYSNEELREGVIELTDGIYNQTLGIATRAMLIQSSTFPPRINRYVTAGYSLSTFIQDTSNRSNSYVNYEIFSFDYFKNLEGLDDQRSKDELISILETARKNTPWKKLIEMQSKPAWQISVERFRDILTKIQSVEKALSIGSLTNANRRKLQNERHVYQNELKNKWKLHIAKVSKMVNNRYWEITPTEISFNHPDFQYSILIKYGFLRTKLDMEDDEGFNNWQNYQIYKGRLDDRTDSS